MIADFIFSASTPGRVLPSSHSRKAPPAVEIYENWSLTPAFTSAAAVSPPPATLRTFFTFVAAATALATALVAVSNGSISNAPIGPFQIIVEHGRNLLLILPFLDQHLVSFRLTKYQCR